MLIRKLHSARYRVGQAVQRWHEKRSAARKQQEFRKWLTHLRNDPPQVLIGSNFAEYGGVRHHLHAIQRYSALRTELAPSDELLEVVIPHELTTTFKDEFLAFTPPPGMKAVHSHVFPWFIEWCRKVQGSGASWVHTYHLPYFAEHAIDGLAPWQQEINAVLLNDARHADVRISVSRWQQHYLRDEHSIETTYLPNGVDVAMCDLANADRFRQRFGASDFVLYVGRNDPVKNPADFVRLAERMPDMQFVMIGRELDGNTIEREWGVAAPANLRIHGEASHAQTLDAIAACSALVLTSHREGLPTLVLEAMALEKPIVVPDERGCVEATAGNKFGFVYAPGDIMDLAQKTSAALGGASRREGQRHRVLSEYDWRVIAPRLDAIYLGGTVS